MKEGLQHGRGIYIWANREYEEGEWRHGKMVNHDDETSLNNDSEAPINHVQSLRIRGAVRKESQLIDSRTQHGPIVLKPKVNVRAFFRSLYR